MFPSVVPNTVSICEGHNAMYGLDLITVTTLWSLFQRPVRFVYVLYSLLSFSLSPLGHYLMAFPFLGYHYALNALLS